jgi:HPt (histidine-containing phosphotransfer) domain-containing protein
MPTHSHEDLCLSAHKTSAASNSKPLIDMGKLHHRIGRNAALLRDLVSLFLSTQPKDLKSLRRAVEANDLARSKTIAHRIAGAFASLSAEVPAAVALDIEALAAASKFDLCLIEMAKLEKQFETIRGEFATLLSQNLSN